MPIKVYGGWNNDDRIRTESSSGGVFTALAKEVIHRGGVVYGATLVKNGNNYTCVHDSCDSVTELYKFHGSKYAESVLGDTFKKLKKDLDGDRYVLFSGTPCQVGGLKAFLGKKYEKLITVDFICHGTPSYKLFNEYQSELVSDKASGISCFKFRDKNSGWEHYSIKVAFENGTEASFIGLESVFMKLFLSNMYLKESCFNCGFKGTNRASDITLGDFWGVSWFHDIKKEDLEKGVSILLVNTKLGEEILNAVEKEVTLFESSLDIFKKANIYFWKNAQRPYDKQKYEAELGKKSLDETLEEIEKNSRKRVFIWKVENKIKSAFGRDKKYKKKKRLPLDKECYSCTSCENICPRGAIVMEENVVGFKYPKIVEEKCVHCGLCMMHCPRLSINGNSYVKTT